MRIGVLDWHQKPTDKPAEFVSKSARDYLLRKLLATRISKSLIQRVRVRPAVEPPIPPLAFEREATPYKGSSLPPREVPGVYFEEPKSATWRLQHRTAWQSYPQEAAAQ